MLYLDIAEGFYFIHVRLIDIKNLDVNPWLVKGKIIMSAEVSKSDFELFVMGSINGIITVGVDKMMFEVDGIRLKAGKTKERMIKDIGPMTTFKIEFEKSEKQMHGGKFIIL